MYSEITSELISESWPTLSSMTYLNTASTGIPTEQSIEGMIEYMRARTEGRWSYTNTEDLYRDIREYLAHLLGGDASEYAFIPSTSVGINSFAYAIDYPPNSNIVICDLEFPSNYIPWQNLCKHQGIELRVAKSVNGAAPIDSFLGLIDENTRVVAVSHVQFSTGYKSDLKSLSNAIHAQNGYLVADIIQSAGVIDFDLTKENVDFAASQATKWLAGPIGAGFIFASRRIWKDLHPKFVGWKSVKNHRDFGFFERELLDDTSMFHAGSPPMAIYAGFRESLKILLSIDGKQREKKAIENANYLKKRLTEENINHYDFGINNSSPIISARPDGIDNLEETLRKDRIYCSVRYGRLRISPHFYNNFEEIDILIDKLKS